LLAELAAEVPFACTALTVYVYVPPVISLTVIGEDEPEPVRPDELVTV
jgi:hypothetical protein